MRRYAILLIAILLSGCEAIYDTLSSEQDPVSDQQTSQEAMMSAADADVESVRATQTGDNTWSFSVTVRHPDTGWEDYADGWDVVLPDGTVANPDPSTPFTRLLIHPHVTEQPFTRNQSNILIPGDVTEVRVRAHDLIEIHDQFR